jgi:hypothetical protein
MPSIRRSYTWLFTAILMPDSDYEGTANALDDAEFFLLVAESFCLSRKIEDSSTNEVRNRIEDIHTTLPKMADAAERRGKLERYRQGQQYTRDVEVMEAENKEVAEAKGTTAERTDVDTEAESSSQSRTLISGAPLSQDSPSQSLEETADPFRENKGAGQGKVAEKDDKSYDIATEPSLEEKIGKVVEVTCCNRHQAQWYLLVRNNNVKRAINSIMDAEDIRKDIKELTRNDERYSVD